MFPQHFFELLAKILSGWLAWRVKALGGGTENKRLLMKFICRETLKGKPMWSDRISRELSPPVHTVQCTDAVPAYIETQGPRLTLGSKWVGEPD